MNIVLMTSRSGSSLVCKILAAHGLKWQDGDHAPRQNSSGGAAGYPTFEHPGWKATMKATAPKNLWPLGYMVPVTNQRLNIVRQYYEQAEPVQFVKIGVEFAALWSALADDFGFEVKFIKVRRPVEQVAASLARRRLGSVDLGIEVAERRFKLMDVIEGVDVHTDILVNRGMWRTAGMREALEQCGVVPNNMIIREQINPGIFHE